MYLAHTVRRSPRRARLVASAVLIAVLAFALVWIGRASADEGASSSPDAVATSFSNIPTGRAAAVDAADPRCRSEQGWVDMPGMSATFSLAGTASRPVLVFFQGEWGNKDEGFVSLRLTIDEVVQPGPGEGLVVHEDDTPEDFETNGFNFISASLASGTHTATIQWYANDGFLICVVRRSLIVLH